MSDDSVIAVLKRMKYDTKVMIKKLELIREHYIYYKNSAYAFNNAISNFTKKMEKELGVK